MSRNFSIAALGTAGEGDRGSGREGAWITAADHGRSFADVAPSHGQGLFAQKSHGFLEEDVNFAKYFAKRHRLYHRAETGAYLVGPPRNADPGLSLSEQPALILWYGFSPWRPEFIKRRNCRSAPKSRSPMRASAGGWRIWPRPRSGRPAQ